jgi:hypothetical protein
MLPRALVGGIWDAGRARIHTLPSADAMVKTTFIRRRNGFTSSALRAFLTCALAADPGHA